MYGSSCIDSIPFPHEICMCISFHMIIVDAYVHITHYGAEVVGEKRVVLKVMITNGVMMATPPSV